MEDQFFITHISKYSRYPSTYCGVIDSVYEYADAREGLRSRGIGPSDIDPWDYGFTRVSHGSDGSTNIEVAHLDAEHKAQQLNGKFSTHVFGLLYIVRFSILFVSFVFC